MRFRGPATWPKLPPPVHVRRLHPLASLLFKGGVLLGLLDSFFESLAATFSPSEQAPPPRLHRLDDAALLQLPAEAAEELQVLRPWPWATQRH